MHAWVGVSVCVIAHEHQAGLEEAWETGIRAAKSLRQTLGGPRGLTAGILEETGGPSYRRASGVQGSATGGVISLHQVPERPISMCVSVHEAAGRAGVNYWIY